MKSERVSEILKTTLPSVEARFHGPGHRIWEIWGEAVGPELARRTVPVEFKSGKLTIGVDGSSWLTQITFMSPAIIEAVNSRLGLPLVKKLRAIAASVDPPPAPKMEKSLLREGTLTNAEQKLLAESTAGISDPELAESIRNARETALRRSKPHRTRKGG